MRAKQRLSTIEESAAANEETSNNRNRAGFFEEAVLRFLVILPSYGVNEVRGLVLFGRFSIGSSVAGSKSAAATGISNDRLRANMGFIACALLCLSKRLASNVARTDIGIGHIVVWVVLAAITAMGWCGDHRCLYFIIFKVKMQEISAGGGDFLQVMYIFSL